MLKLKVPGAESKIRDQIEQARELRDMEISSWEELDKAKGKRARWENSTRDILANLFDDESVIEGFNRAGAMYAAALYYNIEADVEYFKRDMAGYVNELECLLKSLTGQIKLEL